MIICFLAAADRPDLRIFQALERHLSFSFPAELAPLEPLAHQVQSGVVALLKHHELGYPTFNIVEQPVPYLIIEMPLPEQARRVLDSYRLIGIMDAQAVRSWLEEVAGIKAFSLQIKYTTQGRELTSEVTIIPADRHHLILTYIDLASSFSTQRHWLKQIKESMRLDAVPPAASLAEPRKWTRHLLGLCAVGFMMAVYFALKRKRKNLKLLLLVVLMLFPACSLLNPIPNQITLQSRLEALPREGLPLLDQVIIHWNDYMVPFVEARHDRDLGFALGMLHGHLRLAQMELLRHISQGRLSEIAGPFTRNIDKSLRILDLGRSAPEIVRSMPEDSLSFMRSFVEGLNYYQEHMPQPPPEYRLWGLEPESWALEDLVTLARLVSADVNWFSWFGQLELTREPKWPEFWRRLRSLHAASLPSMHPAQEFSSWLLGAAKSGSNALALSPKLSAYGAAVLASDPHVGLQVPNFWLIVGVASPSYHSLGLMFPGVPVVLIGRNDFIAWGATNMRALSSSLHELGAQELSAVIETSETIKTRWWFNNVVKKRTHRLGPLISDAPVLKRYRGPPLALRWVGHTATDEITALLRMNRARSFEQFRSAFEGYAVSGQNYLYADIAGNIGQIMAVRLPQHQDGFDQSFVLKPEAAWQSYLSPAELPYAVNPDQGFLASANNAPLPGGSPAQSSSVIGLYFSPNDRFLRLSEMVQQRKDSGQLIDLPYLKSIQTDVCSHAAKSIRDLILSHLAPQSQGLSPREQEVVSLLESFDGCFARDSRPALAFQLMQYYLARSLYWQLYGEKIGAYLLSSDMIYEFLKEDLSLSDSPHNLKRLGVLLRKALSAGARRLQSFAVWGDLHRLRVQHPLGRIPLLGRFYSFGDYPADGATTTLMKTAHALSDRVHHAQYGANARCITDLGGLNENYFALLGGQDGFLGSPHFIDQLPLWRDGEYIKLPLELSEVRAAFGHKSILTPKN